MSYRSSLGLLTLSIVALAFTQGLTHRVLAADETPKAADPAIHVRLLATAQYSSSVVRISKDPRNGTLYYAEQNGSIYRLDIQPGSGTSIITRVADSSDHGQTGLAGFDVGLAGEFYVVGNSTSASNADLTSARVMRGALDPAKEGQRQWTLVARTEEYERSRTAYDHLFNAVEVSPDGQMLYLNSGSRTDHGEIQSTGGAYPNLREGALTSTIFRIPAASTNLVLPNDRAQLRADGRIFCEGVRNTYDLRFAADGELYGTENGPDRDMPEEVNWLREGRHYGFPWRMGGLDNPQQFQDYDPATDNLLDGRYGAVAKGFYRNDPSFPTRPAKLTEPILNVGPDADSYRDPATRAIRDASQDGIGISTLTAHRSPLGLVLDEKNSWSPPYRGGAFVLSWTRGDPTGTNFNGPFFDAGQDLLHFDLKRVEDQAQATVKKVVTGFQYPIDAEVLDNRIIVLCFGGDRSIWEVTLPVEESIRLGQAAFETTGFGFGIQNAQPGACQIQTSSNLVDWTTLKDLDLPAGPSRYLDTSVQGPPSSEFRFYRVIKP